MTEGSNKLETSKNKSNTGLMRDIFHQENLSPFLLCLVLQFLQNWAGVNIFVFKTVNVFETVGSSIDKDSVTQKNQKNFFKF